MKSYMPFGTVGYYITLKGAKKMLPTLTPIWYPIDEMFRSAMKSKIKSYMPVKDLVRMPYKYKSNIWSTGKISQPKPNDNSVPKKKTQDMCKYFPNRWSVKRAKQMIQLLKVFHDMAEELKIDYCIIGGSAIGHERHNKHPTHGMTILIFI